MNAFWSITSSVKHDIIVIYACYSNYVERQNIQLTLGSCDLLGAILELEVSTDFKMADFVNLLRSGTFELC